jgi:hypothetical protein
MIASAFFPVDSLRNPAFVSRYGVSSTIMDYARQNYVAQPADGLQPKDFVRRLGPFDDFVINWGYRVIPEARTPEDERPILNRWYTEQPGPRPYRYLPQFMVGVDPRAQTEDIGDDPIRASGYGVANLKRVVTNLVSWTTKPGEDFADLNELYGETLAIWNLYMGHVTNLVGGLQLEYKTADQAGAVYGVVPRARQKAAVRFLTDQVFTTPDWLLSPEVISRIGPPIGQNSVQARQANVLTALLAPQRLGRLAESATMDSAAAYPLAEFLEDVRRGLWSTRPDAYRRGLQRVHLERLEALMNPPPPPATPAQAGFGGQQIPAILLPPNVRRADISALARAQLRTIQTDARRLVATSTGVARAHYQDVVDRVDAIFEKAKSGT